MKRRIKRSTTLSIAASMVELFSESRISIKRGSRSRANSQKRLFSSNLNSMKRRNCRLSRSIIEKLKRSSKIGFDRLSNSNIVNFSKSVIKRCLVIKLKSKCRTNE
jgi:hypothetical protein